MRRLWPTKPLIREFFLPIKARYWSSEEIRSAEIVRAARNKKQHARGDAGQHQP